ncbi:type II toxin-antitoxin system HicB family antitoxin [Pasteurellaceae bacterium USgator11]|nr:type II toxin-antitoxin system HicB family antitoxin [Pasteurellaceae bacterium USgator41]TNG96461.1 type II toxin-antitoxin system HicB family antitoxin [Pasteurellaceae bacterium UScroc12]TNH00457.1 type II toxin-antitoxin system HicB family antitoxin [Pasteurellaceae bacterium UScroc31]TNH01712.1 type II toxin-antitoxin system HicB family antitoxin [Pasteurellaceae bacterium USgator11]
MLYPLVLQKVSDGYVVLVPDVPGCYSAGDTFSDALSNAVEAIESHIELMIEAEEDIPQPLDIGVHRQNPDYQSSDLFFAGVDVDLSHVMGKSEKINVTLPSRLIRRIDQFVAANGEYKSRSGFLAKVASDKILSSAQA